MPTSGDGAELVGTTIAGKYFLHELLGRGGMGDVYKATALGSDRPVALKVLARRGARTDPTLERRFEREAAAASRLCHPNVVEVVDFGAGEDGALYLAMELVPGRTLAQLIAEEAPLAPATAAHLLDQVLSALAHAHARGIVHRDLKPANVMVDPLRDPAGFVKVVDFGLATLADSAAAGEERLTGQGVVYGTAAYMSPEQIRGEPLDARSDLYSAGVMLFELLTGALPFDAATPLAIAARHLGEPAPRVTARCPEGAVPPALDALVARALEKDPALRPASADTMRAELVASIEAGGRAPAAAPRQVPPTEPLPRSAAPVATRRGRSAFAISGVAAAVLVALAVGYGATRSTPHPDPLPAERGEGERGATPARTANPSATAIPAPSAIPTPTPMVPRRRRAAPAIRLVRAELGAIATPDATTGEGVLVIVATPWAEVAVGGVPLGEAPREVRIAAGTYAVRAVHPELGALTERVTVGAGERRLWAAKLEP